MRSLLLLGTSESIAAASAYARQAQGRPLRLLAMWLARMAPADLAGQISDFAALDHPESVVDLASRHWPTERRRLLGAWLRGAPAHWPRLLRVLLHEGTLDADIPVVLDALRAQDEKIREATVWFILGRIASKAPIPEIIVETIIETVVAPGPASAGNAPTWERLGRELVARSERNAVTPDRANELANYAPSHPRDLGSLHDLAVLSEAERDALRRRLGAKFTTHPLPNRPQPPPMVEMPMMRAAQALYPGFLRGLLSETGCEWSQRQPYAAVHMTYSGDGRPARAELEPLSESCRKALTGLVQVALADEFYRIRDGARQWLVLFLRNDVVACADLPEPDEPRDLSLIQTFTPPRRTKTMRPTFPQAEAAARATGSVRIEGTLSRAGCLRDAVVPEGTGTYTFRDTRTIFAAAALEAVLQWRFEPARAEDRPVSVHFNVSIAFTR